MLAFSKKPFLGVALGILDRSVGLLFEKSHHFARDWLFLWKLLQRADAICTVKGHWDT